jgi:hypothetical protein
MTRTTTLLAGSLMMVGLALLPNAALAQRAAGVVTTLQGTATVARTSVSQPTPQLAPLKFRDSVFEQDRITTGEQSIARILLGGRAVVTIREHSSLTITETPTISTIDISSGKIALAVAKDRMKPGDRIDIKTPNAVAGVRGTVVIAEVTQATAQGGGTPPSAVTSRFTLLTGIVDVSLLDPTTGRPGASHFTLNPLQTLGVTGFTPPTGPRNISRAEARAAAKDYKIGLKDAPKEANAQVTDRQVEEASTAAAATAAGATGTGDAILQRLVTQGGGGVDAITQLSGDDIRNGSGGGVITPPPPPRKREECQCPSEPLGRRRR